MDAFIRPCHGTLSEWLEHDPILAKGEVVLVATDDTKPDEYNSKKVGDGVRKFSQLPMLGYECLQTPGDSSLFPMSQKAVTEALQEQQDTLAGFQESTSDELARTEVRQILKEIYCPGIDWAEVAYIQANLLYRAGGLYYNAIYLRGSDDSLILTLMERSYDTAEEAMEDMEPGLLTSGSKHIFIGRRPERELTETIYDYYDVSVSDNSPTILGLLNNQHEVLSELEGKEYVREIYAPGADMDDVDHIDVNLLYQAGSGAYYNVAYLRKADGSLHGTLFSFSYDTYEECLGALQEGVIVNGRNVLLLGKIPASTKTMRFHMFYDISDINNSPCIADRLFSQGITDNVLFNSFIHELYSRKADINDITSITLNVAKPINGKYYNSLYLRKADSTSVIFDENFPTLEETLASFKGIKGNETHGYALISNVDMASIQINQPVAFKHPLTLDFAPSIRLVSVLNSAAGPLKDKKVVWEGDSIMADNEGSGTGWRARIQNKYGMNGVNRSRGGSTFTANLEGLSTVYNISLRIDDGIEGNPDADYFILDGGTNDADRIGRIVQYKSGSNQTQYVRKEENEYPEKFGSWTDKDFSGDYDKDTFCGAVEYVFYKLMTSYRNVKIGFIVAPKMGRTDSLTYYNRLEYFREIMAIAKKWGIPTINLWEDSLMNPNIPNQYNSELDKQGNIDAGNWYLDGQHPSPAGYDYSSKLIADWMSGL